jgi:hypothetical protein
MFCGIVHYIVLLGIINQRLPAYCSFFFLINYATATSSDFIYVTSHTLDFKYAPFSLQDGKCFEIWMVFHALSGTLFILLNMHKLCIEKLKKSNHLCFFFCLQLHIGFCILAAVAPPIVFKGKSLTYAANLLYALNLTCQYCFLTLFCIARR